MGESAPLPCFQKPLPFLGSWFPSPHHSKSCSDGHTFSSLNLGVLPLSFMGLLVLLGYSAPEDSLLNTPTLKDVFLDFKDFHVDFFGEVIIPATAQGFE